MPMNISDLEQWYLAQCNGDWEHQYGIKIETLDNPGWILRVDLKGTPAESRQLDWKKIERSEHDWIHYRMENKQFVAAAGPKNLNEAIDTFLRWFGEDI
jgi:hypothetical protein